MEIAKISENTKRKRKRLQDKSRRLVLNTLIEKFSIKMDVLTKLLNY